VLPCHYGTFPILDQTADAFVEAMEDDAENVAVPKSGESVTV
jgi:L-ascorbate metabolism protein UlaG (beta-lactamase superfamily)